VIAGGFVTMVAIPTFTAKIKIAKMGLVAANDAISGNRNPMKPKTPAMKAAQNA
jgi:hypothetical protein